MYKKKRPEKQPKAQALKLGLGQGGSKAEAKKGY